MTSLTDARWRIHPIGRAATLARAARDAVLFGLFGLLALFGVAVVAGIVTEEVFPDTEAGITLDLLLRASLVGILVLALLGALAYGLLGALSGPLMARALASARDRGAPATAVPFPLQWDTAQESSARAYKVIAIVLLALLGLFYVISVFAVFETGLDGSGLAILGGGALMLAVIWGGIPLTEKVLGRRQREHAENLGRHWTPPHRMVAASRELLKEDVTGEREQAGLGQALPGAGLRRVSTALTAIFTVSAMVGTTAFELLVAISYPGATRHASRQLGERADLSPENERLVDLLALGMGILGAVGVLSLVGVVLCTIVLRRLEHGVLRRALEDPAAVAPPLPLLRRVMAPTSLTVLRVLFGLAGSIGALGIGLWFIGRVVHLPDWDHYAAASPELRAATPYGPWVLLGGLALWALGVLLAAVLDARDQGLRDELVQRWPVRPPEKTQDEEGSSD